MKRILYTGLLVTSFFVGREFPRQKEFSTLNENKTWYLNYNQTNYPINLVKSRPQLGTTEYRMKGLLDESLTDLKYSLDKVKEKFHDSN